MLEIIQEPGSVEWWGEYEGAEDDAELLAGFAIELGDRVIGWVGFTEETALKYPSVGLDIMLSPDTHGNGYGPEALRLVIDHFVARGHRRFTIDPAAANEKAIHAYESVGFKPIGVARQHELSADGTWHDGLLMDLLADELVG
jgi:aminoglycoside 6'-N-acetyltransferase